MAHESYQKTLNNLLTHLPFSLDASEAVGDLYQRWLANADPADKQVLDLWVYCYICRYFLYKYLLSKEPQSVLDEAVSTTYQKIEQHAHKVRHPAYFAHWVRAVCFRSFISFKRNERLFLSLDEEHVTLAYPESAAVVLEPSALRTALQQAIAKLPPALQPLASLYFLDNLDASEIASATSTSIDTVYTYLSRSKKKLRKDKRLKTLFDQLGNRVPG